MKSQDLDILNSFIKAPDLKIHSEKYSFENFNFLNEVIVKNNFVFPENLVLGMQAEACFEAYLKQSINYKLLAANLQINGEKETLGELDFIVKNLKNEQVIHIELACKFYLYDENAGTTFEEKWIGPNRKDSLFDKLEKVRLKQFPLLQKTATIQKLKALDVEMPTSQQLCLKAFLFLPKVMETQFLPQNYINCIVGYWIKVTDFIEENEDALYGLPTKKEWLLPMEAIETWLTFSEAKEAIEIQLQAKKSPLVYKKTSRNTERFFVVWW